MRGSAVVLPRRPALLSLILTELTRPSPSLCALPPGRACPRAGDKRTIDIPEGPAEWYRSRAAVS